ncbi:MAG TPA: oligosaccharide flippase family protein [Candidatus Limnocylindria bacterium]|nr:oligosaccharide flippase family protein [Candidatus Limnocylindria bacterium]
MSVLARKLRGSRFFRSLLTLSAGTVLAQLITVLASPLLTRLFSEYELALYAYALAIANTFMASVNGAYNNGIVVEGDEGKMRALVKLSLLVGFGVSAVVALGTFGYLRLTGAPYPALLITGFVLLTLLTDSVIQVLTAFNNRRGDYRTIASVGVWRSLFQSLGSALAGVLALRAPGLLGSYVAGNLAGIRRQARDIKPELPAILATPAGTLRQVARENRRYPLFAAPARFINSFSYSSVTLFIEALFDIRLLAYYAMSSRIMGLPLNLISANVGKIFFADASAEFRQKGAFPRTFDRMALFLLAAAAPMGVLMALFAPPVSRWAFGPGWEAAGEYIRILSPLFCVRFVASALSPGYMVCGRQRADAVFQTLLLIASVLSFALTKWQGLGIEAFLWLVSLSKSAVYLAYVLLLRAYSRGGGRPAAEGALR